MRISRVKTLATFGLLSLSLASCAPPAAKEGWNYDGFKQWHPHSGQAAIGKAGTQCFFCEIKDMDSDGDGVMDKLDKCPGTSKGLAVDAKGCPRDSDGDGVSDDMDNCPGTPPGAVVNQVGCPTAAAATVDNDADGVIDSQDNCPGTPTGAQVNSSGCWVLENLHFDSSKAVIKPVDFPLLDSALKVLTNNPDLNVEIQGHTDSSGNLKSNRKLSEDRARAVKKYLVDKGISSKRIAIIGYGPDKPIADNATVQGRAMNRRVQLDPLK